MELPPIRFRAVGLKSVGTRVGSIAGLVGRAASCAVLGLIVACTTYSPEPLAPAEELARLQQRTLEDVRIDREVPPDRPGGFDPTDGLDEAELVSVALTLNPALRAKRSAIGEAESLLVGAGIWPNPELGASIRPGVGGTTGVGVGLDLLFELLRREERTAREGVASAGVEAARAELAAEEYRVAAKTRRAHIEVLAAEQVVLTLEKETSLREEAVALLRHRRELGEATELDVVAVELERANTERSLREARFDGDVRRRTLLAILGLPPTTELFLTGSGGPLTTVLAPELDDDELDARILAHRLDLKAAEASFRIAEEELRLVVARQYPRVAIGPSFEREVEGTQSLGIGASVEIPLFDRNQGEIAAKGAARDLSRVEYLALLHDVRAEAFSARAALARSRLELEAQERDVVPLVERTESLFGGAFEAREVTVFEWLAARGRALDARRGFVKAVVAYATALTDLEAATGAPVVGEAAEDQSRNRR